MDMTNSAMLLAIALVFITATITKVVKGRIMSDSVNNRPPPPVVNCYSIIGLLHTLYTKGLRAMILDQYTKLGSVFTVSFFGQNVTFLVGPEVSGHIFQGMDSEISPMREFLVPLTGKEVGYGIDATIRNEQNRFFSDELKPLRLRSHVGHMLQEVEDFFAKWGEQGTADLRQEIGQLLVLISGRRLIGKEIRDNMSNEFFTVFDEMVNNGFNFTSALFPYAPTLANRRRDRARAKISEMFTEIVRSRKSSNQVNEDVLQNLIDSKYRGGRPTTESEVTGLIITLLIGGSQTSSAASIWTGARLLSHPSSLAAAVEEQKHIIRKYADCIDYDVLLEMDTLHCCIKEALRMHPPGSCFFSKVHKNFTVRTKEGVEYKIPRGHTVASPMVFNNYIPNIFKEPDVYDPSRFGPAREEDRVGGKFSYAVFGGGRHACTGEAYAYMQIKVIWSYLLRNFELKLVSPFPETDWSKLILWPKGKVMVSYKRQRLVNT